MSEPFRRQHVIPVADGFVHIRCSECRCSPFVGEDGVTIHHAHDGREKLERQGINSTPGWVVLPEDDE